MAYGELKVDSITFTDDGSDVTVSVSGLVKNPTFSGDIVVSGNISGITITGDSAGFGSVTGVTVTGTTANFVSGVFTSQVSGAVITGNTAGFTTVTGTTVTGTTANFATVSGTTVTGGTGNFTSISATTTTITSGVFASGTAAAPSVSVGATDNGIYSPGADQLAISTNGQGRLFVDDSGNVGVDYLPTNGKFDVRTASNEYVYFDSAGSQSPRITLKRASGTNYSLVNANGVFGIYKDSDLKYAQNSDTHRWYVGAGSEVARITSDGKLGLGTSSPSGLLHLEESGNTDLYITSGASNNSRIWFGDSADRVEASIQYNNTDDQIRISKTGGTGIVVDSSNRVGIGTTSPASPLDISCSSATGYPLQIINTDTTPTAVNGLGLNLSNGVSGAFFFVDSAVSGGLPYNVHIKRGQNVAAICFDSNTGEHARIDSSGRLLVGTSTSLGRDYRLQLAGIDEDTSSFSLRRYQDNSNSSTIEFTKSRGASVGSDAIVNSGDGLGVINFKGYDGSGYITSAQIAAEVDGTPGANDMPGRLVFSTTADGASSPTERMRIDNAGNVFIGTQVAPSGSDNGTRILGGLVDTSRNTTAAIGHYRFYNPNGLVGSISTSGSATAYNTSSDYRLKENVVPLTGAANRLNQLQVHRFNFIADPDTTVDGFLAHEAQAIVPECVTGTKDEVDNEGNPVYQGIDQSKMVPLAVAAIQECIKRIEALETELALLKSGN